MAILEYEAELTTQAETFIVANYTVDQPEELEIAGKLRVRLPSKITIDLSQAGISFPEGTNINFTMSEGFVREEWGGSNQTAIPEVSDFFTLRTPIQGISTLEPEFTLQDLEYTRFRDNEIEADALFTPNISAFGQFVGEIPLFTTAQLNSIVGGIYPIQLDQQNAVATFDEDYTRLRLANIDAQILTNINVDNTRLRFFSGNIGTEFNINASGKKFKGIVNENFAAINTLDNTPNAIFDTSTNLSSSFNVETDEIKFTGIIANVSSETDFEIPKIDGVPLDNIATLTLNNANTAFAVMAPNSKVVFRADDDDLQIWEYDEDIVRNLDNITAPLDTSKIAFSPNNILALQGALPLDNVYFFDLDTNFNDTTSEYQRISSIDPPTASGNLLELNFDGSVVVFHNSSSNEIRWVDANTGSLIQSVNYNDPNSSVSVLSNNVNVYISNTDNDTTEVYSTDSGNFVRSENFAITFATNDIITHRTTIPITPNTSQTVLDIYNLNFNLLSTIENETVGFGYGDYVLVSGIFSKIQVHKVSNGTLIQTIDNAKEVRKPAANEAGDKFVLFEALDGFVNINVYEDIGL